MLHDLRVQPVNFSQKQGFLEVRLSGKIALGAGRKVGAMKFGAHRGEETKALDVAPRERQADGCLASGDARTMSEVHLLIEFDHLRHDVGLIHLALERLLGHGLFNIFLKVAGTVDIHEGTPPGGRAQPARKRDPERGEEDGR